MIIQPVEEKQRRDHCLPQGEPFSPGGGDQTGGKETGLKNEKKKKNKKMDQNKKWTNSNDREEKKRNPLDNCEEKGGSVQAAVMSQKKTK